MSYDYASAIMMNTMLDSVESEDGYYLFSEGMEERLGENFNNDSELSGGSLEELNSSDQADATPEFLANNDGRTSTDVVIDTDSQPTGGFPPIYIVTKKVLEEKKDTKSRELSTRSSAVSITDILKKKKLDEAK